MNGTRATVAEWSSLLAEPGGDVEWFDVQRYLSKRGHKYQTRGTKLWLAACSQLVSLAARGLGTRTGIAVGTNFGAHRTLRELEKVIVEEGAEALSPSFAPNFCINLIASHAGIKYQARGFNLTITTPGTAGLDSIAVAARELSKHRCDVIVAGAAEELEPGIDAADRHVEGAIAIAMARSGSAGLADLSGFAELWVPKRCWDEDSDVAGSLLSAALQRHGLSDLPAGLAEVVLVANDPALASRVTRGLACAGVHAGCTRHVLLEQSHGSIEPLAALRSCLGGGVPILYVYAGSDGPVRLILIDEPISTRT